MMEVVIAAHPKRARMALDTAERSDASMIIWDHSNDEWNTHSRALDIIDSEHGVILQDDALPVPGFYDAAEQAIEQYPDAIISFYVGTGRPMQRSVRKAISQADRQGASWLRHDDLLWGVGIALPSKYIPSILKFDYQLPYDQRLGAWARENDVPVMYTWPSLVDHRDTEGLVKHHSAKVKRVAHRTGVPERWDTPVINI